MTTKDTSNLKRVTKVTGMYYEIWDGEQLVAKIMQSLTSGRPTGRWTFQIVGRPGENSKMTQRSYPSRTKAEDAFLAAW